MKTIYVGLSGGVDSSVSASLLQEQGYSVVGVYMKNWTRDVAGVACPWKQDLADARAAAAVLDIPFKVMDFQAEYKQLVVDAMVTEYQAGCTPNPDIMCNQEIKFKLFLRAALADGADMIATGHYAGTKAGQLLTAADANKDQTYFLYRVTREALERTLFPLSGLTKPEVRAKAAALGLPTATKPDSQGICFVGEVGMKEFLRQYLAVAPGPVVNKVGKMIGTHDGAVFYTIGQRHGLGIGGGKPFYVTSKNIATNTVYVTDDPADLSLEEDIFFLKSVHWINDAPAAGEPVHVRVRHRGGLIGATLEPMNQCWRVRLMRPERAISPGQSAVVYRQNEVLGGGIISSNEKL